MPVLRDVRASPHVGRLTRYALALGITAAATLVRLAMDPLIGTQIPYFVYIAAVVLATWFCGVEGGILATITSGLVGNYLFVAPRYELIPNGNDWIALALFAAVCAGLIWQVGRWRRTDDALRAMMVTLRDLHAEAERANTLKDEFLATLSHELRTPLNAIVGWTHMLRAGHVPPDRFAAGVGAIDRNAQALTRLIADVLDVSRVITGRLQLNLELIDPLSHIEAAVEAIRPAAEAKDICLRMTASPAGRLVADPVRLQQIVWNLVSNAVKFTGKGGRVDLDFRVEESVFVLEVSDNGAGIRPEFLPHLFERFTQQDGSTTRVHGGLGLGLAIVRHVVELHGGTVAARSQGEGTGATFTVWIPIRAVVPGTDQASHQVSRPRPDAVPVLRGVRVLAVDDDPDARALVAAALSGFGAEVRTAESAGAALDLVRHWRPQVLVADIGMPIHDGYWLIQEIRRLPKEIGGAMPAIALTAYVQAEDCRRAFSAGFQGHVAKPVAPEELGEAVARAMKFES